MSILTPKKWKYRKQMRWRIKWISTSWNEVSFWEFWMKSLSNNYITNRQIEAARKIIVRSTKKVWKMWIRIFPDIPYTKKWLEMPMWKWKWDVDFYRVRVKRWRVLFEVSWIQRSEAENAFKEAAYKLPIKIKFVEKWEYK